MKKIIGKFIDLIIWLIKPRIIVADREFAEHLTTYCGGQRITLNKWDKEQRKK